MFLKKRNDKAGPLVAEALNKRGFDAYYVSTAEEAKAKALELIPEGSVVSWGGSITVDQIGLKEEVLNKFSVINRDAAKSPEERMELMRQALTCDTFLMSANAITEDGQLVNIDGNGNRVAALCFGPKEVIVVAGMNKVVGSLEDAWDRARNYAAPVNAQRFELPTPCGKTGLCADCKNSSTICTHFVVTRMGKNGRIKVI
ncbi:MAG: lactate utilization protein, partial [Firmicutes bacterium]|nr:lactate utilization protein [Bacillota bacterium]